jgi:hypothetical protein
LGRAFRLVLRASLFNDPLSVGVEGPKNALASLERFLYLDDKVLGVCLIALQGGDHAVELVEGCQGDGGVLLALHDVQL